MNTSRSVSFGQAATLNLGNYESTRLEVSVVLPVADGLSLDEVMQQAVSFVEKHLQEQVNSALNSPAPAVSSKKLIRRK